MDSEQVWRGLRHQLDEQLVQRRDLLLQRQDPAAQDPQGGLGGEGDWVATGAWPQGGCPGADAAAGQPVQPVAQLVGGGEAEMADLVERL
jgi:hypothetical protein